MSAGAFSTRRERAGTDRGSIGMLKVWLITHGQNVRHRSQELDYTVPSDPRAINKATNREESTLRKTLFRLITTSGRQSI